ncbi:MAG: hypothetical protein RLY97_1447 [Pseudomonadota bacterium]
MTHLDMMQSRRNFITAVVVAAMAAPFAKMAHAQGLGGGLSGLLGKASDSSLDKLAVPGAFYNDTSIRIGLPGLGAAGGVLGNLGGSSGGSGAANSGILGQVLGQAGSNVGGGNLGALAQILGKADRLGLTGGLTRSLNTAAGLAVKEVKPIFRSAISKLSISDIPNIASQNDGASQYLRRSAGDELHLKLRPLMDSALGQVGAFRQLDRLGSNSYLAAAGLNRDGLSNSVTKQALNGIFKYIGVEEGKLRANPLGAVGGAVGGLGGLGGLLGGVVK